MATPSTPLIQIRPRSSNQTLEFWWLPLSNITSYLLYDTLSGDSNIVSSTSTYYKKTGLVNKQEYRYTLQGSNAYGLGTPATFRTVQPGLKFPFSIYNLSTSVLTSSNALIEWKVGTLIDSNVADVKWQAIFATPINPLYSVVKKGMPSNARDCFIKNLDPSTSYSFSVYSVNDAGYSPFYTNLGLNVNIYSGYFADDPNWFLTQTPSYTSSNINDMTDLTTSTNGNAGGFNFSVEWTGYFLCRTTGTHTFFTASDDASYLWIGSNAVTGYTTSNALINNGGIHITVELSNTIYLEANTYYPIRIQYGNNENDAICQVSFFTPTTSKTSDFNNYFFLNN